MTPHPVPVRGEKKPGWHLNRTRTLADVWQMPGAVYRLTDAEGNFLHQNGQGMTGEVAYAWRGNASQLAKVQRCLSAAAGLKSVRITG
jgi:hypothetical protein